MGEIQDKEMIAELCGAIIGDGWIQSDERCCFIAGDPLEDKEYYEGHLSKLFGKILTEVRPRNFPYWKVYGIGVYHKELVQKLISFNIPTGKKVKTARVPPWIMNSNEKIVASFLRGYFDTDGSVFCQRDYTKYANPDENYHSKIRIRISSVSEKLIEDVYYLGTKLGYKFVKRKLIRGPKHNRNNNDVFILELNEIQSIVRWFEELSPSNPKHFTKYLIWKKYGFCPPSTTILQRKEIIKNELNPYQFYKQG